MKNDSLSIKEDTTKEKEDCKLHLEKELASYEPEIVGEPEEYERINFLKGIDWYTEELAMELQSMCSTDEKNGVWEEVEAYHQLDDLLRREVEELEEKECEITKEQKSTKIEKKNVRNRILSLLGLTTF